MARRAEDQAIQVLEERLQETLSDIAPALASLARSAREVLEMLEREDALRRAVDVIGNPHSTEGSHGRRGALLSRVQSRVRRSAEELTEAARQLERHSSTPGLFDGTGVATRSPVRRGRRPATPRVSIERVAKELAEAGGGRVAARDVAQRLMEINADRYTHMRSAYGSVFAHLERNPRFDKAESGVFVFVGDEDSEDAPLAPPEDGESRADVD